MKYRDSIVASIGLTMSTLGMAIVVASGAYEQAAGAEARGLSALSTQVARTACADPLRSGALH